MAFTNMVCKQDVLSMVAMHRWHRPNGREGLSSFSCFPVDEHDSAAVHFVTMIFNGVCV
jgi:hypothetical protein